MTYERCSKLLPSASRQYFCDILHCLAMTTKFILEPYQSYAVAHVFILVGWLLVWMVSVISPGIEICLSGYKNEHNSLY